MTSDNWCLQNLLISMMYRSVRLHADPGGNLSPLFPGRYLGPKTILVSFVAFQAEAKLAGASWERQLR